MTKLEIASMMLVAAVANAGCGAMRDSHDVSSRSAAMVFLDGARDVQYFRTHDGWGRQESEQLSYLVTLPFPATEAICRITADLKKAGWRPLQRNDDDSKTESSFTHGWREMVSLKGMAGEAHLDQWLAEWVNGAGDHLSYALVYRSKPGEPRGESIRIGSYLTPARLVKAFGDKYGDTIPDTLEPRISETEIAGCANP